MKHPYPIDDCDVAYALSIIGGKWKLFLLRKLMDGPMRYSQLRRTTPGISEPVLIRQLRELCQAQLVYRKDFQTVPPRVEYALTTSGQDLQATLVELERWGKRHRNKIKTIER